MILLIQFCSKSKCVHALPLSPWPTPSPDFWKMGSVVVVQPCSQTNKQHWKHNLLGGGNYWSVFVGTSKRPHTQLRFDKLVLEWSSKFSCVSWGDLKFSWRFLKVALFQLSNFKMLLCSKCPNAVCMETIRITKSALSEPHASLCNTFHLCWLICAPCGSMVQSFPPASIAKNQQYPHALLILRPINIQVGAYLLFYAIWPELQEWAKPGMTCIVPCTSLHQTLDRDHCVKLITKSEAITFYVSYIPPLLCYQMGQRPNYKLKAHLCLKSF